MAQKYDFSGYATRNDLRCSDGLTIKRNAFKDCDGATVPLVWQHNHNDPLMVLGHALLENREDGVYAYCSVNDTENGRAAKEFVEHGDVTAMSIYANKLKKNGNDVVHGRIREVSLVLAGANPGAMIDIPVCHSDDEEIDGWIYSDSPLEMYHAETEEPEETITHEEENTDMAAERTVKDVFDEMTDEQKNVVYFMVGQALEEAGVDSEEVSQSDDEGEDYMKHNVFENEKEEGFTLSHSDVQAIVSDMKRYGSLKDSVLAHTATYGIEDIDYLFPDARTLTNEPEFIKRETEWVAKVMNGTKHSPFSRIKSIFADITEDEARAKGYIKGKLKKEEVFSLLKRTTTPTTIYKKQKLDRDDILDITDFDVVAYIKKEMRIMLDEEIARAILIGDGRLASSDDKINEQNIRPIVSDADLYTVKYTFTDDNSGNTVAAKEFIKACIKSRKLYKGSGNPLLFTTEDMLTDMLLLEDGMGRPLYDTEEKLRTALRVKEIVTVPVMEELKIKDSESKEHVVYGIYVNLADYNVGADKGGQLGMFDDFDIDYNQQKYLMEGRCSGALVKPYAAVVLQGKAAVTE